MTDSGPISQNPTDLTSFTNDVAGSPEVKSDVPLARHLQFPDQCPTTLMFIRWLLDPSLQQLKHCSGVMLLQKKYWSVVVESSGVMLLQKKYCSLNFLLDFYIPDPVAYVDCMASMATDVASHIMKA
ncbi:hypothetical protein Patl1_15427 [Pistacia atlantica]|uniref:Uncharacterized protein n=1 Tax=Pistacia atlantica TaxID=434234 RepID=A0ACC1BAB6_9ROSI|nr:hypothetical protein Patl1_15427 [Pistacia atlantica]